MDAQGRDRTEVLGNRNEMGYLSSGQTGDFGEEPLAGCFFQREAKFVVLERSEGRIGNRELCQRRRLSCSSPFDRMEFSSMTHSISIQTSVRDHWTEQIKVVVRIST